MSDIVSPLRSADLAALVDSFAQVAADDVAAADAEVARELLATLQELERVKAAAGAAQVRATVAFGEVAERLEQARREKLAALVHASGADDFTVWRARKGRTGDAGPGLGAQVGLARRLSPHRGARAVATALTLTAQLPHTLRALTTGVISEQRAEIVVRETRFLSDAHRSLVDQEVATDPDLGSWGDRELEARIRAAGYRLDPHGATDRAATAATDRHVSIRPLPEAMCRVSALLPLTQGVATYAALRTTADAARTKPGEDRTLGQVMADTLVERVTGQAQPDGPPVEVQVVISDSALFGSGSGRDDPGYVPGYGPVPSGWVRDLIRGPDTTTDATIRAGRVWLRRLYATPDSSQLVAMESTRRLFTDGLRRFLIARDKTCRTPWCDAPIRHLDHVHDHVKGGRTEAGNGQGTCVRCNHTKQHPDWHVDVTDTGDTRGHRHRTRWRTPLGATYEATAPPLLYAQTPRYPGETYDPPEELSILELALRHDLTA